MKERAKNSYTVQVKLIPFVYLVSVELFFSSLQWVRDINFEEVHAVLDEALQILD